MIRQSPLRDGDGDGGGKIMIVKTQDLSTLNFCDYRFFAYFRFSSCYRIPESELTYFIFFFQGSQHKPHAALLRSSVFFCDLLAPGLPEPGYT